MAYVVRLGQSVHDHRTELGRFDEQEPALALLRCTCPGWWELPGGWGDPKYVLRIWEHNGLLGTVGWEEAP